MARIREIKKYGDSRAIKLEPSDLIDLGVKEGDMVDIDELVFYNPDEPSNKNFKLVEYTAREVHNQIGDELLSKFVGCYK